ncbi:MAG: hypothetical protein M0004_06315 [Actinomycetota bacterium]|nr:hypothetical protein [Actinomycetota bacterium]
MARFIAALIATLMLLGTPAAYAAQPAHPAHPGAPFAHRGDRDHADATYALRGTLSNYVAPSATANGSITVTVFAPQGEDQPLTGTVLTGTALTFAVTSATRIVLHGASAITNGDRGTVLVRAPKGSSVTTLEATPALAVIDQAQGGADLGDHGGRKGHADATYVLRGTLSNYIAPSATANGSITVTLLPPPLWDLSLTGTALTGTTLTVAITTQTRVVLHGASAIANGDRGTVLVRAPKGSSVTTLEATPALAVIDQADASGDRGGHEQHVDKSYVIRGTLSNYIAPSATANGSITVTLAPPRFWGVPLTGTAVTGTSLTFSIATTTRIVLHGAASIANGDPGLVKVRAPRNSSLSVIEATPASAVIDRAGSR